MILDNLFFFHLVSPIRTSADLLCWGAGSPCLAIRALPACPSPWSEGRRRLVLSCSQEVAHAPEEEPAIPWEATYQRRTELLAPTFARVLPENGAHWVCGACPAWHAGGDVPPWHCAVCHLCPCLGRVSDRQQLSERLSPPQGSVGSARAGMHL